MATDNFTATQDQFLGLVRDGQEAVVKAVQTWAESFTSVAPSNGDLPFADLYRQPAEAVDQAFEFSEKLLAAQRDFTKKVWAAAQPVWDVAEEQAEKATKSARSATKA
jgi:hypothetical protein